DGIRDRTVTGVQTCALPISLNGGAIEGFLRTDDLLTAGQAVYRTLGTGVTFNLAGNSFIGQNINQGVNGLDDGRQPVVFNPLARSEERRVGKEGRVGWSRCS